MFTSAAQFLYTQRGPLLLAVLAVSIVMLTMKPSRPEIVWQRVKAREEVQKARYYLNIAERQKDIVILRGHYRFSDIQGTQTLQADLTLPQGCSAGQRTPFEYHLRYTPAPPNYQETVSGTCLIKGKTMSLFPDKEVWTLHFPQDRSLIREVSSQRVVFVSATDPQSQNEADLTTFERLPQ